MGGWGRENGEERESGGGYWWWGFFGGGSDCCRGFFFGGIDHHENLLFERGHRRRGFFFEEIGYRGGFFFGRGGRRRDFFFEEGNSGAVSGFACMDLVRACGLGLGSEGDSVSESESENSAVSICRYGGVVFVRSRCDGVGILSRAVGRSWSGGWSGGVVASGSEREREILSGP